MGRRRRMRRVFKKSIKPELFRCPSCHHNSIIIEMSSRSGKAKIICLECKLVKEMEVSPGEEEVDVYTRFYDSFYEGE